MHAIRCTVLKCSTSSVLFIFWLSFKKGIYPSLKSRSQSKYRIFISITPLSSIGSHLDNPPIYHSWLLFLFILHVFFSQAWLLFTQFYIPDFPPYYYLCDIFTPAFFSITSYIPYVMNPLFFRRTSVPFAQWHCYTIYSHRVTSQVFWIMSFKGILLGQWVIITFSILLDNGRLFSKGTIPSL